MHRPSLVVQKHQQNSILPEYNGRNPEFARWAEQVRNLLNFKQVDPYEGGDLIRLSLRGHAFTFITQLEAEKGRRLTDSQILEALNKEFDPQQPVAGFVRVTRMTPMKSETFGNFMRRLEDQYDRLCPTMPGQNAGRAWRDVTLIGLIYPRLPPELKAKIPASMQHGTYAAFRTLVNEEESFLATAELEEGQIPRKAIVGSDITAEKARPRGILKDARKVSWRNNELSAQDRDELYTDVLESVTKNINGQFADMTAVVEQIASTVQDKLEKALESRPCGLCGKVGHSQKTCPGRIPRTEMTSPTRGAQHKGGLYPGTKWTPAKGRTLHHYNQIDAFEPYNSSHPLSERTRTRHRKRAEVQSYEYSSDDSGSLPEYSETDEADSEPEPVCVGMLRVRPLAAVITRETDQLMPEAYDPYRHPPNGSAIN
ncbi:MAG: hypothetical protein WBO43_13535, partial [Gemmatimonadota bacterium]